MITFRKLIDDINKDQESDQQSPLEVWFESVLDVPIDSLAVEDLCRAIRQKICIEQLMPRVLAVLTEDPLAGEYYDGELISSLSTLGNDDLKNQKDVFFEIIKIINQIDFSDLDSELKSDILKIKKINP
ncbi:contact-dependent growth inhibition system immunity protein [Dickeya zeae]|uniref:contact-dependent growth inhibition system immunity protein n=1 Tax=Dickeya zeae TaxID=204042 RepID=UPI002097F9A7|nr:contact-dependent growth inhibition system immunity protein [Dickeya zeae]MCO7263926.1 contact-dependent growth inhibition system immunity protein [Dickeya zeae]